MQTRLFPFLRHRFLDPLKEFLEDSRAIGIVLLTATALSLLLANLPVGDEWRALWHLHTASPEWLPFPGSLEHWINDGLMTLFFLLAGLEIKSELTGGELSTFRKAALPVAAAIGGMVVPGLIYGMFNHSSPLTSSGWGVPMATDIAFAIGVSSLLGPKFPFPLKVFLVALATIDDLGAILVIALFYGGQLSWIFLAGAGLVCGFIHLFTRNRKRFHWLLAPAGLLLWYFVFRSGIHATIAGVAFGLMMPPRWLHRISLVLHNYVYFLIVPLFALANTPLSLSGFSFSVFTTPLAAGVVLGLLIGKPLGIAGMSFLMVKLKWAELPSGTDWKQMTGAGLLAGIGFTMSIFIASLAFGAQAIQHEAKLLVLAASSLAIIGAYLYFRLLKPGEGDR